MCHPVHSLLTGALPSPDFPCSRPVQSSQYSASSYMCQAPARSPPSTGRRGAPPTPSLSQQRPGPNPSWAGSLGQPRPPVSLEASGILLRKQDAEWSSVSSEAFGFVFLATKSSLGPLGWPSVALAEPCRTPRLAAEELVSEHSSWARLKAQTSILRPPHTCLPNLPGSPA